MRTGGKDPKSVIYGFLRQQIDVVINGVALTGTLTGFDEDYLILFNEDEKTEFMVNRKAVDFLYPNKAGE